MGIYVIKRLGQALLIVVGVSIISVLLIHLSPGDPVEALLGPHASRASIAAKRHELGLDQSLPQQYLNYINGALHGNFGQSILLRTGVGGLISPRILPSVLLMLYSIVVALLIAVPLAVLSAGRRNRLTDHLVRFVSMVSFAMPPFWLGLVLILGFSIKLTLLPTAGYGESFPEHLRYLTLPALTLALGTAPLYLRTLRSSLLDTMSADFVDAARAHGLSERRVMYRHVLRNSLLPMITVVGVNVAGLFSIMVAVESVFSIPGLGQLLVTSVTERDFAVIQTLVLFFGLSVVLINLVTDLTYRALDPRVRL